MQQSSGLVLPFTSILVHRRSIQVCMSLTRKCTSYRRNHSGRRVITLDVSRLDCLVCTPMVYVGRCKTIFLAGSAGRQTIEVVGPYNGIDAGVGTGEGTGTEAGVKAGVEGTKGRFWIVGATCSRWGGGLTLPRPLIAGCPREEKPRPRLFKPICEGGDTSVDCAWPELAPYPGRSIASSNSKTAEEAVTGLTCRFRLFWF